MSTLNLHSNHLIRTLLLFGLTASLFNSVWANKKDRLNNNEAQAQEGFELKQTCPSGFERMPDNGCELRTLYQFYSSNQNKGVGGTQTGLPDYRDGFTPQQIDLGRYLFFDPILSADQTLACASCHKPQQGFSDGRARSVGAQGQLTERSAPSLWNSAFQRRFFWDARATSLEQQAIGPLYATNEMNNTPAHLLETLNQNKNYRHLFAQAFEKTADKVIELAQVYTALAAFQSSLISLNSPYDQYAHGNHEALSDKEIAGLNVFRSFVARCAECHTPPLFTNQQIAVIGTPEPNGHSLDIGAEKTYSAAKFKAGFKVPSLRNIAQTAPYMHSGVFPTLKDVVGFYNKGRGHAVPKGVDLHLHWHITEPDLSDAELDFLVLFLQTLSDERFMPQIPQSLPSGLTPVVDAGKLN